MTMEANIYQTLFESANEAIFLIKEDQFVDCNQSAIKLLGCTKDDVLGSTLLSFSPHTQSDGSMSALSLQDKISNALANKPQQFDWLLQRLDGKQFYTHTSLQRLDINGQSYLQVSARDVTRRKQTENALIKRATELETVAEVGVTASTVLETEKLLQTVVDLVKDRFSLYHAHIYLLDEGGRMLNLTAGAGDVGRKMVNKGWRIPFDRKQSLVAQAARTRHGVIVNDVRQDPNFLPNELLPNTQAEMAVPMIVGDILLGVLDVQADEVDHFSDEDVRIQTTLAAQVAVALQNAKLYAQTQTALTEARMLSEVSQVLTTASNLNEGLEGFLTILKQYGIAIGATGTTFISIKTNNKGQPENGLVEATWRSDGSPPNLPLGTDIPLNKLAFTQVWMANPAQPIFITEVETDKRVDDATRSIFQQGKVKSAVTMPLSIANRWVGLLFITWENQHQFLNRSKHIYSRLITQVASIFENRSLFQRTEVALAEIRQLATIVENHPDFIGRGSLDGVVHYLNPSGFELMGLASDHDVSKMTATDFYPEKYAQILVDEGIPTALKTGTWSTESQLRKKNGSTIPVEQTLAVNYDLNGKPDGFIITMRDITNRKKAEKDLQKAARENSQLAAAVNNATIGITISDPTLPDNPLVFVNPAFTTITGYTSEEALGKNSRFLQGPDTDPTVVAELRDALQTEQSCTVELVNYRKDGTPFTNQLTINPIFDNEGHVINYIGLQYDITDRREADAERDRLLAELEVAYRETIRQDWQSFLGQNQAGKWRIEHEAALVKTNLETETLAQSRKTVLRQGKTKIIHDTKNNGDSIDNAVITPLLLRGQVVGTVSLQDIDPTRHWTQEDVLLVEAVSEQLTQTLENLRLVESTQRRASREQVTRQIADKMRANPNVDSIIETGLEELAKVLGVSRVYVKLASDTRQDDETTTPDMGDTDV